MISAKTIMCLMAASSRTEFEKSRCLNYVIDGREFRLRSTYSVARRPAPPNFDVLTIRMRSSVGFTIKVILDGYFMQDEFGPDDFIIVHRQDVEIGVEKPRKGSNELSKETMEHHLMMLALRYSE